MTKRPNTGNSKYRFTNLLLQDLMFHMVMLVQMKNCHLEDVLHEKDMLWHLLDRNKFKLGS
jgi:hypothetical protein